MRRRKGHAETIRRREIVPGVSSLTTCDELREAKSEIKRVPENSRGSARSNYLRKARGVRTDCGVDIFSPSRLYFSIGPAFAVSFSLSRLPSDADARDGQPGKWKGGGESEQRELFWITFFCAGRPPRDIEREREDNETWNSRNSIRRINYDAKDPRGARRTAGRNLISLANEFLSKSRVSRLM